MTVELIPPRDTSVPILEIDRLSISYLTRAAEIPAVVDFSLTVRPGECVGLVGESGCGKSTVAMAIMRYLGRNGRIAGGTIKFHGRDLMAMSEEELRRVRGAEIAMVYQEPMAALNPAHADRRAAGRGAAVPRARLHPRAGADRGRATCWPGSGCGDPDGCCGLSAPALGRPAAARGHRHGAACPTRRCCCWTSRPPRSTSRSRPASSTWSPSSAGPRHRHALHQPQSRADPRDLRPGLRHVCRRGGGGGADRPRSSRAPRHPYTQGLFGCIPTPGRDKTSRPLVPIRGQLPLPQNRPKGCVFAPRCDYFEAGRCDAAARSPMLPASETRGVRCLRWQRDRGAAAGPGAARRSCPPPSPPSPTTCRCCRSRRCASTTRSTTARSPPCSAATAPATSAPTRRSASRPGAARPSPSSANAAAASRPSPGC